MTNSNDELRQIQKALSTIVDANGTKFFRNDAPLSEKISSIVDSYSGDNWHDINTEEYSLAVSDNTINEHIDFFYSFFRPFMDDFSGLIGVNSVIRGAALNTPISVSEFVKNHIIRATIFLGLDKVSKMLVDWKNTNQLNYSTKYYFQGIDVKSMLSIEGMGKLLPPDRTNFDTKIIGSKNNDLDCGEGTIAVIKNIVSPIFYKPDSENGTSNVQLVATRQKMMDFGDCLSLVLNRHISLNAWWLFDKELKPFFSNNSITTEDTERIVQAQQTLSQSNVNDALGLLYEFISLQNKHKRLRVAIQRWLKSVSSNEEYEVYSNLRTALDAVFTNEGENSSSDKLAITASKFIRTDSKVKIQTFKLIKDFHRCASIIIHGGQYDDKTKDLLKKINIKQVQGICSEAIIKVLKSGKIPWWVPIALE